MKIRSGFVSNSSSSSFLIVGKRLQLTEEHRKKIDEDPDVLYGDEGGLLAILGLSTHPDDNFQVMTSRDYPDEIVVGFGSQNMSEYNWNQTPIADVQRWIGLAAEYFGNMNLQVLNGVVDPGH